MIHTNDAFFYEFEHYLQSFFFLFSWLEGECLIERVWVGFSLWLFVGVGVIVCVYVCVCVCVCVFVCVGGMLKNPQMNNVS